MGGVHTAACLLLLLLASCLLALRCSLLLLRCRRRQPGSSMHCPLHVLCHRIIVDAPIAHQRGRAAVRCRRTSAAVKDILHGGLQIAGQPLRIQGGHPLGAVTRRVKQHARQARWPLLAPQSHPQEKPPRLLVGLRCTGRAEQAGEQCDEAEEERR